MNQNLPIFPAEIEQFCARVQQKFHPDCIILHGSVARGTFTSRSDVDIIIIGGDLAQNFFTRTIELNRLRDGKTPLEVIGYTLDEWEQMIDNLHLTVLEALQWGIPLRGEALFAQWRARFAHWQSQGLRRGAVSWSIPPVLQQE